MATAFVKIQGCANDFIVVDRRREGAPVPRELAVRWCDRHRGVGADGVLSLLPSGAAPIAMHVTNPDGSVAEMCGNGLRCVVRWAIDHGVLPASGGRVETGRGVLDCVVGEGGLIRVDMGPPILEPAAIPTTMTGGPVVARPVLVDGTTFQVTCVSMGNPHAVAFIDDSRPLEALAKRYGPLIEHGSWFPQRTNVGFARMRGAEVIELFVWERGAGLTQACGTGACAAGVAAVLEKRAAAGRELSVQLPGGVLLVTVPAAMDRVFMAGPAQVAFEGAIPGAT